MMIGAALSVVIALALTSVENRTAADDAEIRGDILKLASAIENGNDGAKSQAEVIAKKAELEDVMGLFRLRTKKGIGVGDKPGVIKPDGIEAQIMNLGKRELRKEQLAAESVDLARAAYIAAAIAEIAEAKCPVDRKQGEKDPNSWRKWAEDMHKSALELAKAANAHKGREVKTAANKLNSSCNACHAVFRE
jgi:hypothetical protein